MAARLITIFGGAGFVGKTLVGKLAKTGVRLRIAVRRPNASLEVLPLGEIGQIQIVQANLKDEASVRAAINGSDVVINLAGANFNTGQKTFDDVHSTGAGRVAQISAEYGVEKLVHLSSLNVSSCDLDSDEDEGSKYTKSKALGEEMVLKAFPNATILRPSAIFGQGDETFTNLAKIIKVYPITPLFSGETKYQPVYVGDVADAIIASLSSSNHAGKTYELGGNEIMTYREMYEQVMEVTGQETTLIPVPAFVAPIKAFFLGLLPNPVMTLARLRIMADDSIVTENSLTLIDMGIAPTSLMSVLPIYMEAYQPHGQFSNFSK